MTTTTVSTKRNTRLQMVETISSKPLYTLYYQLQSTLDIMDLQEVQQQQQSDGEGSQDNVVDVDDGRQFLL